jgi:hypothetical protein
MRYRGGTGKARLAAAVQQGDRGRLRRHTQTVYRLQADRDHRTGIRRPAANKKAQEKINGRSAMLQSSAASIALVAALPVPAWAFDESEYPD